MSFTPVIASTGYQAWQMLSRTKDRQMEVFGNTAEMHRDEAYFRENIGKVGTAADLVADRRLLKVALSAFGLEGDMNNRAFIRKILEDGTLKSGALSSRLADKRYAQFSRAFGFDLGVPRTKVSGFAEDVLNNYRVKSFGAAVGEVAPSMRLALAAQRELPEIAAGTDTATTKWYRILGSPPLRKVIEVAFGLPTSFAAIGLDQQLTAVKAKANSVLGSDDPAVLANGPTLDKVIRLFTLRDAAQSQVTDGRQFALQMLSSMPRRRVR